MPWGTLGLATVIGAALAGLDPMALGCASCAVSTPVFLALGAMALWVAGERRPGAFGALIAAWFAFIATLALVNGVIGPEIAGVGAGGLVLGIGLALTRLKSPLQSWPRNAWPYMALLFSVVMIKTALMVTSDASFVVKGASVSWKPLESPGIPLGFIFVLILLVERHAELSARLGRAWAGRSWKPLATIFFFLLMSQGLLKGSFLTGSQAALSGYLTGSNVGGNAIFMPGIARLHPDRALWFSAIQNSGAGHGALGSLSIIALVSGSAKTSAAEEQALIRFAFAVVCLNTVLVGLTGSVIIALS